MMKTKHLLILLGIFSIAILSPDFSWAAGSTEEYDFGNVAVGSKQTASVSISNLSGDNVELSGFSFAPESCIDFSIETSFTEPIPISAYESVNVEIGYAPLDVGGCSAILYFYAGYPVPSNTITLYGTGVEPTPEEPTPDNISQRLLEKLQKIIDYTNEGGTERAYRSSAQDKLSERRLKAFKKSLVVSYHLIENDHFEAAHNKLKEIHKKTDGKPGANDFVPSEKAPQLASMLQDLIDSFDFEGREAKHARKSL
ncbi:MAG: hypothetical protein PVF60_06605 [Desulfobacterales bacterium]|jgi:hypothetical protein